MLAAGLGMAVPVLVANWAGRLPLGVSASAGSLLVGGALAGRDLHEQARILAGVLAPLAVAALAATLIAGRDDGWTDAAVVVLGGLAAVCGGYSRPLAAASIRFVAALIIVVGVVEASPGRWGVLCLIGAGALWQAALVIGFGCLARWRGPYGAAIVPPSATAAQKFARWRHSLTRLSGWQCALRLGLCLGAAGMLRVCWPGHHFIWISLTVAILLRRQPQPFSVRTTQRAIGVLLGVAASGLFMTRALPAWILAILLGLLGGMRPWLQARNYLFYAACTTPLVILMLDAGRPIGGGLLGDRLVATVIGAALVTAVDLVFARAVARQA